LPGLNPKSITKADIEAHLNDDSVEGLKRRIETSYTMLSAVMDEANISEIRLRPESLMQGLPNGHIESYYDIDTNTYVVVRVKAVQ